MMNSNKCHEIKEGGKAKEEGVKRKGRTTEERGEESYGQSL